MLEICKRNCISNRTQQTFSSSKAPEIREAPINGAMVMNTTEQLHSKSANVFSFTFIYRVRNKAAAKDAAEWPLGKLSRLQYTSTKSADLLGDFIRVAHQGGSPGWLTLETYAQRNICSSHVQSDRGIKYMPNEAFLIPAFVLLQSGLQTAR